MLTQTPLHPALKYASSILGILVLIFLIWNTPNWFFNLPQDISQAELAHLTNDQRRTLVLVVGAVTILWGMYLLHRRFRTMEKDFNLARSTAVTDRFAQAVEQLGAYKIEIQLSGIYTLEKLARDSENDHWTIMEILTAYVRENAKWSRPTANEENGNWADDCSKTDRITPEIQAILTVIGRRNWVEKELELGQVLNLRRTNLAHADLRRANLISANLRGANLEGANLFEANLAGAFLAETNLKRANLYRANMDTASLVKADLRKANLKEVNVDGANLQEARLKGALLGDNQLEVGSLKGANLKGADLSGVALRNVDLSNTNLSGVKYDYATSFPEWMNNNLREELSMEMVRED